jgi:hypothetical protein
LAVSPAPESVTDLAAIAVVLDTILNDSNGSPVRVTNPLATDLASSRWVMAGRIMQTQSWQRS